MSNLPPLPMHRRVFLYAGTVALSLGARSGWLDGNARIAALPES